MIEAILRSGAGSGSLLQIGERPARSLLRSVRTIAPGEQTQAIDVMALAFSRDPVMRWMYPDPHQYLTSFPEFVRTFGGRAFERETAYQVDDFAGAALWLPPGVQPDEDALIQLFERTVADEARDDLAAILEQMEQYHPHEAHWYLALLGVDIAHQGQGYGSALLQHTLAACDRRREIAYLESSSPANVPLYERHGFEVIGEIQAGNSPKLWPMLRQPR